MQPTRRQVNRILRARMKGLGVEGLLCPPRGATPFSIFQDKIGFYQPGPGEAPHLAPGALACGPRSARERFDPENLTGPFDWLKTPQFDIAVNNPYRTGDTLLVPPYAGCEYPQVYQDGVVPGGTAAFANQRRPPVSAINNGAPDKVRSWKITLGAWYVPGTTVRILQGGGAASGNLLGIADVRGQQPLYPTAYTPWAESDYYDINAVDNGRHQAGDGSVIDSGYRLTFVILPRMENEGSVVLPSYASQSSPNGSQATGDFSIGPTGGLNQVGYPGGMPKRVTLSFGQEAVIYATGRSIDVFVYNPNINRVGVGNNDGWYIPGIPGAATYTMMEATPGISRWQDMEEVLIPLGNDLCQLDVPPFCRRMQFVGNAALGIVQLYASSPGGYPSLYSQQQAQPISNWIDVVQGVSNYYIRCAASAGTDVRVIVNYECEG